MLSGGVLYGALCVAMYVTRDARIGLHTPARYLSALHHTAATLSNTTGSADDYPRLKRRHPLQCPPSALCLSWRPRPPGV